MCLREEGALADEGEEDEEAIRDGDGDGDGVGRWAQAGGKTLACMFSALSNAMQSVCGHMISICAYIA